MTAGLLLLLTACTDPPAKAPEVEPLIGPFLYVTLASRVSDAGDEVDYIAELRWSDGTVRPAAVGWASALEPVLSVADYGGTGVIEPRIAGEHVLTASATWLDAQLTTELHLEVVADQPDSLLLTLDRAQVVAGEPLRYQVTANDRFGNVVDASAALVATEAPALVVPPQVIATEAGIYEVVATLDGTEDGAAFRVVAAAPVLLDLRLSDVELERYETTVATVSVQDVYGNSIDGEATVWVEGDGLTTLTGDAITFHDEGWYTVYAEQDGMLDLVGPILIDSTGPTLEIHNPDRGGTDAAGTTTVTGTVSDDWSTDVEVTVNGVPAVIYSDGSFSATVSWEYGLNLVTTVATDEDGNQTSDTRTVLAGDFLAYGAALLNGIVARINTTGFDTLEVLGEDAIASTDLTGLLPSPAYAAEQEDCIDVIFDEVCVTWYSVELTVTNPYFSGIDLELDPNAAGYLDTRFSVLNPSIDWQAEGTVIGVGYSADGTIYADDITATMHLTPVITSDGLQFTVDAVDATSTNFVFDWDSWLYDVMSFFGVDLSTMIQDSMETAIEDAMRDEIAATLTETLSSLAINTTFDVEGNAYTLGAVPGTAAVDDEGMHIGLSTTFTVQSWLHTGVGAGSLTGGWPLPPYGSPTPGMELSLNADFLNQTFYALWGGGTLDQTMTAEDLGLDLESLSTFFPWTDLNVVVNPLLPPVVVPGTGTDMLELQIGDMEISMYDGPISPSNLTLQLYVTAFTPMSLDVDPSGLLVPTLGDMELYFDVTVPESNTEASADTEALLRAMLPAVLPSLLGGVGSVPIPELDAFPFTISTIERDGGFVTVAGDITALP